MFGDERPTFHFKPPPSLQPPTHPGFLCASKLWYISPRHKSRPYSGSSPMDSWLRPALRKILIHHKVSVGPAGSHVLPLEHTNRNGAPSSAFILSTSPSKPGTMLVDRSRQTLNELLQLLLLLRLPLLLVLLLTLLLLMLLVCSYFDQDCYFLLLIDLYYC